MSLLELGNRRFAIPPGEVALGSDPGCAIPLTGAGLLPKHALLQGLADGQVIIRKAAPEADVTINGVRVCSSGQPDQPSDSVDLTPRAVHVLIDLKVGASSATILTNDLTHDVFFLAAVSKEEALGKAVIIANKLFKQSEWERPSFAGRKLEENNLFDPDADYQISPVKGPYQSS